MRELLVASTAIGALSVNGTRSEASSSVGQTPVAKWRRSPPASPAASRTERRRRVSIAGGANVIQHYLKAALLDEIQIHLVPVLIGDGVRLFERLGTEQIELEPTRVIEGPGVTHLRFRVMK